MLRSHLTAHALGVDLQISRAKQICTSLMNDLSLHNHDYKYVE